MATTNSWSPSTITKLKSLLERGLSTSEIGKKLGFTKNAVVGKINRLGLNNTTKKAPAKKAPAKKAVQVVEKKVEKPAK
jgi:GcrA cell cycle regulator